MYIVYNQGVSRTHMPKLPVFLDARAVREAFGTKETTPGEAHAERARAHHGFGGKRTVEKRDGCRRDTPPTPLFGTCFLLFLFSLTNCLGFVTFGRVAYASLSYSLPSKPKGVHEKQKLEGPFAKRGGVVGRATRAGGTNNTEPKGFRRRVWRSRVALILLEKKGLKTFPEKATSGVLSVRVITDDGNRRSRLPKDDDVRQTACARQYI